MNKKVEPVRTSDVYLDFLNDTIPVELILQKLDSVSAKLESNQYSEEEKQEFISQFYEEVKSWEIIIGQLYGMPNHVWLQIPVVYHEVEHTISFWKRAKILFKQGLIMSPKVTERYADVVSNIPYPLEMPIDNYDSVLSKNSKEVNRFYCTASYLIVKIVEILKQFNLAYIAVYKAPQGVIATNGLNSWLTELEKHNKLNLTSFKDSLTRIPFAELLKGSTIIEGADISYRFGVSEDYILEK